MPDSQRSPIAQSPRRRVPVAAARPEFQYGIPPPPSALPQRRPISTSTAPLAESPPSPVAYVRSESPRVTVTGGSRHALRFGTNAPTNPATTLRDSLQPGASMASSEPPMPNYRVSISPLWQSREGEDALFDRRGVTPSPIAAVLHSGSRAAPDGIRRAILEEPWGADLGSAAPLSFLSRSRPSSSTTPTNVETYERHQPRIISSSSQPSASSSTGPKVRLDFLANTLPHHKASPHSFTHQHLPSYLQGHPNAASLTLPTEFSQSDRHSNLTLATGGLCVAFTAIGYGDDTDASAIRTTTPIPKNVGIYYYEVTVMDKGQLGFLSVGFSKRSVHLNRLVGWEPGSWGWHGDDGRSFEEIGEGKKFGPMYTTKDVVGAGVCFVTGQAFFTKNGELIGHAFHNLDKISPTDPLYPSVGLRSPREVLRANFTGPFVFDIDNYYHTARDAYFKGVINSPLPSHLSHLAPGSPTPNASSPSTVLPPIISDYLKHNGFTNVSHRFDTERERRAAKEANGKSRETRSVNLDTSESLNYVLRMVHDLVVIDEIQEATRIVRSRYPKVLDKGCEKGKWGFWLDALAFISVLRLLEPASSPRKQPDEEDMEVDGLLTSPSAGSSGSSTSTGKRKRATSDATSSPVLEARSEKSHLDDAIRLGAELRDRWAPNDELPFAELFTLFGKSKIDEVPEGNCELSIASKERRAWVADGLVRAIRASQGAPTSTTLEQIYRRAAGSLALLHSTGDAHVAFADVKWVMDGKPPS